MFKNQLIPVALSALFVASPLAGAEEAHHPEQTGEDAASATTAVTPTTEALDDAAAGTDPATTEGSRTMQPGMSGQGSGMTMPGMMHKRMMGGMQGMGGGPSGGTMGKGAMMHQGMKGGHGTMQKHRDVVNRLDLIDARLVKIEAMLERLMQR